MVAYSIPPIYSGAGRQALGLAETLVEKGIEVTALTARHTRDLAAHETSGGVTIRRLPVTHNRLLRHLSFFVIAASYLLRHRNEYDIVHLHGAYRRAIPIVAAARLAKLRTVVKISMMGTDDPSTTRDWRFGGLLMKALGHADAVVAITEELAQSYLEAGLPQEHLVRIPNGVDSSRFHPVSTHEHRQLRKRLGLPLDALIIVFVGIVHPRKGVDLLLRAWPHVQATHPEATLLLVGPLQSPSSDVSSAFRHELSKLTNQHGIQLAGQQRDTQRFYQAADLFVLPSRMEGLPNALLEAMACGLPVISSSLAGVSEVIENGRNGLLVPHSDPTALSAAISSVLSDTRTARRLGDAAHHTVSRHYSMRAVADQYLDLYGSLLNKDTRKA